MEQVKSVICDNVAMYAQKYDEEFAPHLPTFVTAVWNLLINTGQQVKYDLVSISDAYISIFINAYMAKNFLHICPRLCLQCGIRLSILDSKLNMTW